MTWITLFSPSFLPSCSVVLSFFPLPSCFPLSILYYFPLLCPSSSLLFYSVLSWSLFSLSLCVFLLLVSLSVFLSPTLSPSFVLLPLFPLAFLSLFLHSPSLSRPMAPSLFLFAFPYCFLPSQHLPFCSLLSWSLFFSVSLSLFFTWFYSVLFSPLHVSFIPLPLPMLITFSLPPFPPLLLFPYFSFPFPLLFLSPLHISHLFSLPSFSSPLSILSSYSTLTNPSRFFSSLP